MVCYNMCLIVKPLANNFQRVTQRVENYVDNSLRSSEIIERVKVKIKS